MRDWGLRTKVFVVLILVCLVGGIVIFVIPKAMAGFGEDFDRASDWDRYHGDVEHKTARLIQSVTAVLHHENMEILKEIKELKEELSELKEMVEDL